MKDTKKNKKWLWCSVAVVLVAAVAVWCGFSAANAANGVEATFKISTTTALLAGIFLVAALGYLLGSVSVQGVSLGTAGVFLVAILFGYLCTLPQLKELPILGSFYIADSSATLNNYFSKVIQNIGLVLFVTGIFLFPSLIQSFHFLQNNQDTESLMRSNSCIPMHLGIHSGTYQRS